MLADLELESFVKTTGGKGLHIVVPLRTGPAWDEVREFARAIAEHLERVHPERFTARAAKGERRGRIYVDYLRNAVTASTICAYSVRARPGAPVAMPLSWNELDPKKDVRGAFCNARNAAARLAGGRDPWPGFATCRQPLRRALLSHLSA